MKKIFILILTSTIFAPSYSQTDRNYMLNHSQTAIDYLQIGGDKGSAGDWNGAIADFTKALELDPDFPYAYYMRGLAESFLEDYEAAISDYTKFIESDLNDPLGYYNRGLAKSLREDKEGALADYNIAIELAPDPRYFRSRGDVFKELNNFEGAILDYSRAISLLPEDDEKLGYIYYYMGYCKVMMGQMEGCLDLGKSIVLGYEAILYCGLKTAEENKADGDMMIKNGDYEGGFLEYTKALELEPNNSLVYAARGTALYNMGDYAGAIADFTKSIELNEKPFTADSYYRRALSKFQMDNITGSLEDLDLAVENDELSTEYLELRAVLKFELGQIESGCLDLKKAFELGSTTAEQAIKDFCN